jgi:FkbM family methyltransferase
VLRSNLGQKAEVFLACAARVIIVEPNILCQPTLSYLFGRNPNAELLMTAVGSTPGWMDLYVHGTDSTASARPEWDRQVYGVDRGTTARVVPVTTLDGLIERYGQPDFVKIDVEGFEVDVLKGLSSRVPLISLEFHSIEIDRAEECLAILANMGKIAVRAIDMSCNWLGLRTEHTSEYLRMLQSINANGDLFVWVS